MDQLVECGGEINVSEREHLIGELATGERENIVCDQQPPGDGGECRTHLLAGRFEIAALEHEPGKAEPATSLNELALGRWLEAPLIDLMILVVGDSLPFAECRSIAYWSASRFFRIADPGP
jgi:hypothetical protein